MKTYQEIISYLKKKKRATHLLLGNGFSMAYDQDIFSYNALHNFIHNIDNELLTKLFEIVNTKDFEVVMKQLDNFCELIDAFGSDENLRTQVEVAIERLQKSLIEAIQEMHPSHVFEVPEEQSKKASKFLKFYLENDGMIFTTNYDLLLYWVLLRNKLNDAIDGFGRYRENPDEYVPEDELEYSELRWGKHKEDQNIHYLHGTLPIFDNGIDIEKEEYTSEHYLLENIKSRLDRKEYPIFVTAGDGNEKLNHIYHNRYLTHCYEALTNVTGSLITFGFQFGENDFHIIDAINIAAKHGKKGPSKLWSIYIGVYSDSDLNYINSIKDKFKCKVNLWDAKTASIWE